MTSNRTELRQKLSRARLYGILDFAYLGARDAAEVARAMLSGGVDIIQIRAKNRPVADIEDIARAIQPLTRDFEALLVINDHPETAVRIGADAVHVGQDDLAISGVRQVVGPHMLVGKSTHSLEQATAAATEHIDYIGVGPLYSTPTKPDYVPVGLSLIRSVAPVVALPQFCIGGIKLENLDEVIQAGARRVVVVSGILQASDIQSYCQKLKEKLASVPL